MALTLANGNYIKIKDGSITATGLQYYVFKDKAAREAMTAEQLAAQHAIQLAMTIVMTGTADATKTVQDNLKTIAYEQMKTVSLTKSTIVKTTEQPFLGATDC